MPYSKALPKNFLQPNTHTLPCPHNVPCAPMRRPLHLSLLPNVVRCRHDLGGSRRLLIARRVPSHTCTYICTHVYTYAHMHTSARMCTCSASL